MRHFEAGDWLVLLQFSEQNKINPIYDTERVASVPWNTTEKTGYIFLPLDEHSAIARLLVQHHFG